MEQMARVRLKPGLLQEGLVHGVRSCGELTGPPENNFKGTEEKTQEQMMGDIM